MTAVTIILTSHMKPFLDEALASVAAQTRTDFECVVVDSGQWLGQHDDVSVEMARIFGQWASRDHPWLKWITTGEDASLRERACPVSVATNIAIRDGWVRGRYVCHFYDDDEYHPQFIEKMAGYLDDHPDAQAVWCTQDRVRIERDGNRHLAGQIQAYDGLGPGMIDCRVDGGQVMYRREVLDAIGDPWMLEDRGQCSHSDGIFLERVASITGPFAAISDTLVAHRFTPYSTYSPT